MKPDSAMSAIRPSMIALVSTTMCGSPRGGAAVLGAGRRTMPDRLGGEQQILAFGDGQPDHPQPEEERDPERQPGPRGLRQAATAASPAGGPSAGPAAGRRPRSRTPRSRAAGPRGTASAPGRSSGTAGSRSRRRSRRRPRRSGRTPTGVRRRSKKPASEVARASPTSPPRAAPSRRMLRITVVGVAPRFGPHSVGARAAAVPSIALSTPRAAGVGLQAAAMASRRVATATTSRPSMSGDEPARGRVAGRSPG